MIHLTFIHSKLYDVENLINYIKLQLGKKSDGNKTLNLEWGLGGFQVDIITQSYKRRGKNQRV